MNVEIETTIRNGLAVIATGTYTPGAAPLPVRGEAMAVHCPGWDEGVEDLEIRTLAAPHFDMTFSLSRDDEERVAEALTIEGAEKYRDELDRADEARYDQRRDDRMCEWD